MAVCEIWDVRGRLDHPLDYAKNPDKTANPDYTDADLQAMGDVMKYAANGDKTEQQFFVTGVNCDPATARDEMMITKAQYQDESKIVCYHGFQSFQQGEVTPEQAHEIGVKLAQKMWGDRFQAIVATHLNTNCLHNHFVVNSVSYADGKHYHDNKKNLRLLRQRSDELCREYALSVIENPTGRKKPYALCQAEKNGLPSRDNVARQAIDEAISKSFTLKDFDRQLAMMGYRINLNPNRKYWTIICKGWERPKRLYKLGCDYTNERITERIRENTYAVKFTSLAEPKNQVKRYRVNGSVKTAKKIGGLRGLYLHYCYCLGILPKGSSHRPLSPELREECRRLDTISQQAKLICREKMDRLEDVADFISVKQAEIKELEAARQKCYNCLRRCDDGVEIAQIKAQRDRLTAAIAVCRKDIKTAEGVLSRSDRLKENLRLEQEMQAQRMGRTQDKHRERSVAR